MSSVAATGMSAEEFVARHARERVELVDGVIRELDVPKTPHGIVCQRLSSRLGQFIEDNDLGWAASNDTFVLTKRGPDRVRGADFAFWSYARLPKDGGVPDLVQRPPELVVEVRSPTDRSSEVYKKVGEYLDAGVDVVAVVDRKQRAATVYRQDEFHQIFHNGDELVFPDVLPGFAMTLSLLFRGLDE